ncbi:MAG TPA: c-type cytochrome [Thermoanaerobaculia bacterium]|nr:c-type cytochrome [Thermoanaerobaculia bacterium]
MTRIRIAAAIVYVAVIVTAARTERAPDHSTGRQIYVSGSGSSGVPITASVGGSSELPATLLPCVNCHRADGRGIAEGGVVPSNITWLELTKPYKAATPNGRRRPAYNEQSLRRAIAEGIDSAGNPLHAAMPRYAMPPDDFSDLVAYLKVLGGENVPGVTATAVRVGTIVPESAAGAQMTAVLSAYLEDAGEIHGRRVTVDVMTLAKLDAALRNDPPFALAGGLIAGADALVEEAVERAAIPLVLPVSTRSDASAGNVQRFYLSPGMEEQLHGLLRFTGQAARVVVVAGNDETTAIARRVIARMENPSAMELVQSATAIPADVTGATPIVFLDPASKLGDLPRHGTSPLLFLGNLLPEDFFEASPSYGERIKVALTTTPGDLTAGGLAEYRVFAARHGISGTNLAGQLSAYAAAKVLVQALKQSGRDLTRDSLRASLESLYEFETGVTPRLTFGRSRRIAAPHVHVATIDPNSGAFVPAGTFNTND